MALKSHKYGTSVLSMGRGYRPLYNGNMVESTRWAPVYTCDDPAGCTFCQRFAGYMDMREVPPEQFYRLSHEFITKLMAYIAG